MSQNPHAHVIKAAMGLLAATAKTITDLFNQYPELNSHTARIHQDLVKPQMYLNSLVGHTEQVITPASTHVDSFKPITTFMGQDITPEQPVGSVQLQPSATEKEEFLAKRDALYARFPEMTNDEVFETIIEPKGTSLLRSVAKKAGHPEYRERPIDIAFIDEIRKYMNDKAEVATAVANADDAASKNNSKKAAGTATNKNKD